ncbi:MAG: TlpA disulfide reductase family protein [Actinomycetota bacterium]|nr:TlpA disulfide reductase family protein [Actinomycetota bacterium]
MTLRLRQSRGGARKLMLVTKVALAVGAALGMLAAFAVPRPGATRSPPQPSQPQGPLKSISVLPTKVDRPAPGFILPLLNAHGTQSLTSLRGKVVVLNFWASWCVACRAEAPQLEALWRRYRRRGVVFLGVDVKDTAPAASAFARRYGVTYASVVDAAGSTTATYGILGLPDTYIVDPHGNIRFIIIGEIDPASFRSALDRVLAS